MCRSELSHLPGAFQLGQREQVVFNLQQAVFAQLLP